MKQLFGALCAMIVGLSALSVLPAAAAGFRDHEGWMGAPPSASMARAGRTKPAAARRWKRPAAHGWTRRPARRTSWARYYAPRPALRTYRTFKRVWFGNKMVWWPTTTVVPVARRASAYRLASWHPRRRWSKGRPVVWHGGYWATTRSGGPGTWTPEPVYRYNPNGSEPTLMKAPTASKAMRKGGSKGIAGYQYYYYGKPTTSSGVKTSSHTTRRTAAALAVPHDNIPTVYLYQKGHRQGIHLPGEVPADSAKPTAPGPGPAPGSQLLPPGAPPLAAPIAPGGLIPGVPGVPAAPVAPTPAAETPPPEPAPEPSRP